MQIPCVYLPGPAPAVTVANTKGLDNECHRTETSVGQIVTRTECAVRTITGKSEVCLDYTFRHIYEEKKEAYT